MFSTETKLGRFYLHQKTVRLKGSQKLQWIYFFSRDKRDAVDLPPGYQVKVTRTGLPVLAKRKTAINQFVERAWR